MTDATATRRLPDVTVRPATPDDAPALLQLYAPYVEHSAVSFEYEVPSLAEFRDRMEKTLTRYPYLVAAVGEELLGYAYTGTFKPRRAYDWAAETSIYIREGSTNLGLGRLLYRALEDVSRAQNIWNLYACIACTQQEDEYLTNRSVRFHERMGYVTAGEFHRCGYKFGRWYNMVWMEKPLGAPPTRPEPLIPFPALRRELFTSAPQSGR